MAGTRRLVLGRTASPDLGQYKALKEKLDGLSEGKKDARKILEEVLFEKKLLDNKNPDEDDLIELMKQVIDLAGFFFTISINSRPQTSNFSQVRRV